MTRPCLCDDSDEVTIEATPTSLSPSDALRTTFDQATRPQRDAGSLLYYYYYHLVLSNILRHRQKLFGDTLTTFDSNLSGKVQRAGK